MRIHLISCFLLVFFTSIVSFAQPEGAGFSALAGAGSALSGSIWSISTNPAGLATITVPYASFTASPAPFGLTELSSSAAAVAWPFSACTIVAGFDRFGFELFRKESAALAFATAVDRVRIGLTVRYYHCAIAGYGSAGVAGIDCGFQIHVGHSVDAGADIHNINVPRIGAGGDPLPQSFTIGVAYQPGGLAAIAIDYAKEIGFDAAPRCGVEYRLEDILALRCGVSQIPPVVCGGFGVRFSVWTFDYAYTSHSDLGEVAEFTLSALFGR